MKKKRFTVGLPIRQNDAFIQKIIEEKESISEVYFSWGQFPSGRSAQTENDVATPWENQQKQIKQLEKLHENGLSFNLLFNANCYGEESLSKAFFYQIGDTVEYIKERFSLLSITTTSPLIAKFIKTNFPMIKTRASVNIGIGTPHAAEYLLEYFDGFYLKREYNKDLSAIKRMREFCTRQNKELHLLANSGCLNDCSAHTFHDNLVAHEAQIAKYENAYIFEGVCRNFFSREGGIERFLQHTSCLRPEDIFLVEEYFDGVKLATRTSPNPMLVLDAYSRGSFSGSLLSLLEPDHSALFFPSVLENKKIAPDYLEKVLRCDKQCERCEYCQNINKNALVHLEDI